ncbi:MAG: ABC transporter ATP-binding protein [Bryobacterales bacterium]|nr:ABC transporter ATP-binding protein [Bryobacterales bacterium]
MSELAIRVERLGKQYRIGSVERYRTLRDTLVQGLTKIPLRRGKKATPQQNEILWAVKDVSFTIQRGEVFGIIGRNGAGKSTLLKILARITDPSTGRAEVKGRVGALIEIGTGFHPELTGRENIFLNGTILGMRKAEIVSKFDEIVDFSEIEKFLDTPVKHYSNGMRVRLAFAVAAHLQPEVLIIDEVLAVGDLAFQKKCLGKMSDVGRQGRTVLLVSHNIVAIENLCSHGIVLDHGKLTFAGSAKDAARHYYDSLSGGRDPDGHIFDLADAPARRSEVGKLLKRIELYTRDEEPVTEGLRMGDKLRIKIHFDLPSPTTSFNVGLGFDNAFGQRVFTAHSLFEPNRSDIPRVGPQIFVCDIPEFTLTLGTYTMVLWLDIGNDEADLIEDAARLTVTESDFYGTGKLPWNGAFVLRHHWYLEEDEEWYANECLSLPTRASRAHQR